LRAQIPFSGCVVAFEEVGVDRRGEGRIVEFDGMVGVVVLRGPAPGGTDLTPETITRRSGALSLVEAVLLETIHALASVRLPLASIKG
jgi:hypothetical protein